MKSNSDSLILKHPFSKKKTISEFQKIYDEWITWQNEVSNIVDRPYNKKTHLEVFADGEDMMERHIVLQTKTITFLDNNIENHWFIKGLDGNGIDRTDLRLKTRVMHRITELKMMKESLPYIQSFIKSYIKKKMDKIISFIIKFI